MRREAHPLAGHDVVDPQTGPSPRQANAGGQTGLYGSSVGENMVRTVGRFPWRFAPAYIVAQLAGATLAGLATWLLYGDAARTKANLAATYPGPTSSIGSSLFVEGITTFILVFVIVSVVTDERVASAAVGPAIGFALAAGVFIAGPITGGAVNPARALGPMIVAAKFTDAWIYIVGPITGGVVAAALYDQVMAKTDAPD